MYGYDDEDELVRQYEEKDFDASDDDAHSSDQMDSDLEDKIMSMIQYGTGIVKKKPPPTTTSMEKSSSKETSNHFANEPREPEVVHAPIDLTETKKASYSFKNELQLQSSDVEEDVGLVYSEEEESEDENETQASKSADVVMAEPQVTRFIDLDDKHYVEEEETSEEEAELNLKLQELIEDQIYNRQSKKRILAPAPIRVCFSCHQPGHDRRDCKLCMDCGAPKHTESRCVGARYCTRCKRRGHNSADCENGKTLDNCHICNISYHHSSCCPSLLHRYINETPAKTKPIAWCYNCTEKGHYGDECPYLPSYLSTIPSTFSKLSLSMGSRFDPKKSLKHSASSFSHSTSHHRWSDSSRESSPRRGYNNDNNSGKSNKKAKYDHHNNNDNYSRYDNRNNQNYHHNKPNNNYGDNNKNSNYQNKSNSYGDNDYKNNRKQQSYQKKNEPYLDTFFSKNKKGNSNNIPQKSGNSNWKALNNNSLPQPTRSGTVNVNSSKNNNQGYDGDFPRGNPDLPKPSSSGVIDLTGSPPSNNRDYAKRGPKYHGGYNRNR